MQPRMQLQGGEQQEQHADHELDRRDRHLTIEESPGEDRCDTVEPDQHPGTEQGHGDGRQPEAQHHAAIRVPAGERELEQAVEDVHDRGQRHRLPDREEQGEGRQQQRPQAEAGEERQRRRQQRHRADDQIAHGRRLILPAWTLPAPPRPAVWRTRADRAGSRANAPPARTFTATASRRKRAAPGPTGAGWPVVRGRPDGRAGRLSAPAPGDGGRERIAGHPSGTDRSPCPCPLPASSSGGAPWRHPVRHCAGGEQS